MKAMMLIEAPQDGQTSGRTSLMRAMISHEQRPASHTFPKAP